MRLKVGARRSQRVLAGRRAFIAIGYSVVSTVAGELRSIVSTAVSPRITSEIHLHWPLGCAWHRPSREHVGATFTYGCMRQKTPACPQGDVLGLCACWSQGCHPGGAVQPHAPHPPVYAGIGALTIPIYNPHGLFPYDLDVCESIPRWVMYVLG